MSEITLIVEQGPTQTIEITPPGPPPSVEIGTLAYVPVPGPHGDRGERGPAGPAGNANIVVADGPPGDTTATWYDTSD